LKEPLSTTEPDDTNFCDQRIESALKNSPAIQQLTANPLLLTMVVIIAKHQELPRERAKKLSKSVLVSGIGPDLNLKCRKKSDFLKKSDF
jgi:hypothetical protein